MEQIEESKFSRGGLRDGVLIQRCEFLRLVTLNSLNLIPQLEGGGGGVVFK